MCILYVLLLTVIKMDNLWFNSLPKRQYFGLAKAFIDDKIYVAKKMKFVLERVENIMGKGEQAGYQHVLLFPKYFQKALSSGSLKVGVVW